jgi:PGAP1-like protein
MLDVYGLAIYFAASASAMLKKGRDPGADLRAATRLAVDATAGLTDLVEAMHRQIAGAPGILARPLAGPARGITGLVYRNVRGMTRLVGRAIDAVLGQLAPVLREAPSPPRLEALLGALNGVVGDHLAATGNALAIRMCLRSGGEPLELERRALAARFPKAGGRLLVLVHGSCMTDRAWSRRGHDHGAALARDLAFAPLYLHYNSGLHVSTNGRAFAGLLEALIAEWPVPVEELVILAHSMGGLVSRSACHYGARAGHRWPRELGKLVFLGTPHHGAPAERIGAVVHALLGASPYTASLARLAEIRGAGITDLRHGNLLDEDWRGRDRFGTGPDRRQAVPLPDGARCHAIAATTAARRGGRGAPLPGDGLVPVDSALGRHQRPRLALPFARSRQWIGYGMNHFALLDRPEVYARLLRWLGPDGGSAAPATDVGPAALRARRRPT